MRIQLNYLQILIDLCLFLHHVNNLTLDNHKLLRQKHKTHTLILIHAHGI